MIVNSSYTCWILRHFCADPSLYQQIGVCLSVICLNIKAPLHQPHAYGIKIRQIFTEICLWFYRQPVRTYIHPGRSPADVLVSWRLSVSSSVESPVRPVRNINSIETYLRVQYNNKYYASFIHRLFVYLTQRRGESLVFSSVLQGTQLYSGKPPRVLREAFDVPI